MANKEDTPHETPTAKRRRRQTSISGDDFETIGASDRELILQWLHSVENNLQAQIDELAERLLTLDTEQMRHLESHAQCSEGPRPNEVMFRRWGLKARGRFAWVALILLLTAVAGVAWRGWPF